MSFRTRNEEKSYTNAKLVMYVVQDFSLSFEMTKDSYLIFLQVQKMIKRIAPNTQA
jgi:hypothetical protein